VLDNGTVRLGPVPSNNTPIPGISINPGGVAVPVPVNTSAPVTGGPTGTSSAVVIPPGGGDGTGDGDGDGDGDGGDKEPPIVEPSAPEPTDEPPTTGPTSAPSVPIDTHTEPGDAAGEDDPVLPPGTFG
jgi:serine/threonine-protein kinase